MANSTVSFLAYGDRTYITKLNQLVADVNQLVSQLGLTANLSAAGFRVTDAGNPVDPGDLVNLSTANALLVSGGTPAMVAVTDFDKGTATAGQLLAISQAGAIVGLTQDDLQFQPTNAGAF